MRRHRLILVVLSIAGVALITLGIVVLVRKVRTDLRDARRAVAVGNFSARPGGVLEPLEDGGVGVPYRPGLRFAYAVTVEATLGRPVTVTGAEVLGARPGTVSSEPVGVVGPLVPPRYDGSGGSERPLRSIQLRPHEQAMFVFHFRLGVPPIQRGGPDRVFSKFLVRYRVGRLREARLLQLPQPIHVQPPAAPL